MSTYQSRSLSISVFSPLVLGADQRFLFELTGYDHYSHTIDAVGGWWEASFTIKDNRNRLEGWLADGLGRHIEVYNEAQNFVFEGFVNEIEANLGPLSITRGPLLDIANRARVIYSTVDTSTSPPTVGVRAATAVANDTTSQGKYGIIEQVLSVGGSTQSEAEQIRDAYLAEHKDPETGQEINLSQGDDLSVTVKIPGYIHWLFYTYSSTTTGTQNLSAKMTAILGQDPNSIFSTNYDKITANTLQVKAYEQDNDVAWDLIKGLVAQGDASDNRYLFGVYENRQAVYEAVPTTVEYFQQLSDQERRITLASGARVLPWNVLPGKWLFISDLLIGRTTETTLRFDPRMVFIESVTYSTPWGLRISGGKVDTLAQKLAKFGLAGVGA
jgi:hypothetical protein